MPSNPLDIAESHSGHVCVVALKGRVDGTNADQLMTRLNSLLASGEKTLVVDFAQVLYLTSAAFHVLLTATADARRKTAQLALCSVLGQVRELFEMAGLLDAFTIHGSREEALARLGS